MKDYCLAKVLKFLQKYIFVISWKRKHTYSRPVRRSKIDNNENTNEWAGSTMVSQVDSFHTFLNLFREGAPFVRIEEIYINTILRNRCSRFVWNSLAFYVFVWRSNRWKSIINHLWLSNFNSEFFILLLFCSYFVRSRQGLTPGHLRVISRVAIGQGLKCVYLLLFTF